MKSVLTTLQGKYSDLLEKRAMMVRDCLVCTKEDDMNIEDQKTFSFVHELYIRSSMYQSLNGLRAVYRQWQWQFLEVFLKEQQGHVYNQMKDGSFQKYYFLLTKEQVGNMSEEELKKE